jgi:hypothetical protein
MNLLLAVLVVTFVASLRRSGAAPMIRSAPLVVICAVVAAAYLVQRVM